MCLHVVLDLANVFDDMTGENNLGISITVEEDDGEPPVISQLQVSNVTTTSATISWQTSEPADTQVAYSPSANYGSTTPHIPTFTETHIVDLTNLDPHWCVSSFMERWDWPCGLVPGR